MEDYVGKVDPRYKDLSDLIYNVYRHGLMHTQMPKASEIDGELVCWQINYDDDQHLRVYESSNATIIPMSPQRFFEDLIEALEKYINDFDDSAMSTNLLKNFKKGFLEMSRVHSESEMLRRCPKGVDYIKSL